jgi:LysM repeat protein
MTHTTLARKSSAAPASKAKAAFQAAPTSLHIGDANDSFEREADRLADEVMDGRSAKGDWSISTIGAGTPLQRKCACGGSGGSEGECEECKAKKLQRKTTSTGESGLAPAIVHEVLRFPGSPLDAATRNFFEPRYGHDFSHVRVHSDSRAAESAEAVDALAYTVGSDIVFAHGQHAPDSGAGRVLLAHELTHIVQGENRSFTNGSSALPIGSPEDAAEHEADAAVEKIETGQPVSPIAMTAEPVVRRERSGKERVPNGEFTFEMKKKPHGLKEDVHITFSPDAGGPSTKVIKFIQIVRLTDSRTGETIPWGTISPEEAIKDKLGPQKNEGNVQAGFIVDVVAKDLKPREKKSDPSLSPEYPHLQGSYSGGMVGPHPGCVGCDLPLGKRDVTMDDTGPGGIPNRDVTFDFESAAYSEDLGIFYGSVRWHFRQLPSSQDSDSFPDERFYVSPTVSDTLRASIVEFNKVLKNKHRVLQGETLASISTTYFRTASAAQAIFELNRDVVKEGDPAAPLPPGIELELPTRWERAKFSPGNRSATAGDSENLWERAKVQRSATGVAPSSVPPIVHGVLDSSGQPLDQSTRNFFEPRLGHDFSRVRVHADSEAAESATAVNALAYTVGNDLVFGHGQYSPATRGGQRLLAHELAHVVQQGRGGGTPAPAPDGNLERDAERAASDVILGSPSVQVDGTSGPGIARVFAPSSLDRQLDPSSMSDDAIHREMDLISRWLKDNPSSPEASRLSGNLLRLKKELDSRPVGKGKKSGASEATDGRGFAELRFPISLAREQASVAGPKLSASEPSSINTPPPASKSPNLDSSLPTPPTRSDLSPLNRDLLGLGNAPAAKTTATTPPPPAPTTKTPSPQPEDEKPGLGLQTGTGEQTGLRAPHQAFQYVQVSAEFSNAYVLSLKDDKLPTFLKGTLESISFLGEPGWTLQYHVAGDKPGTVDLQFLFKLVQLSLRRVDISVVGGEQFVDLGKKWESSRFTPIVGLESETKIAAAGPVSLTWVLDGLAALPQPDTPPSVAGHTQPRPGRVLDGQFSGELRLKLLWDIGAGK